LILRADGLYDSKILFNPLFIKKRRRRKKKGMKEIRWEEERTGQERKKERGKEKNKTEKGEN
jgi:hypothetical protein